VATQRAWEDTAMARAQADACLWHPWLRSNRVLRVMCSTLAGARLASYTVRECAKLRG
jgi:hypothetical protein